MLIVGWRNRPRVAAAVTLSDTTPQARDGPASREAKEAAQECAFSRRETHGRKSVLITWFSTPRTLAHSEA
jgi:hypothetical protein